jgi:hypothetical protein
LLGDPVDLVAIVFDTQCGITRPEIVGYDFGGHASALGELPLKWFGHPGDVEAAVRQKVAAPGPVQPDLHSTDGGGALIKQGKVELAELGIRQRC